MSGATAAAVPADLLDLARSARVTSPRSYVVLGDEREVPEAEGMIPQLELELYRRLYTRLHRFGDQIGGSLDPLGQRDLVGALSAANRGTGTWEAGWRIVSLEDDGHIAVVKDDVTFWVRPEGLRTESGRPAPGGYCRVRVGKELRSLVPGFYVAIGDGASEGGDRPGPLLRLYWHLTPEVAALYMAAATSALNALCIPFRTKVLADPAAYLRADAGVLYVERRHFPRIRQPLREIHGAVAGGLRPEVPMFTRPLAPGLGVAEDPGHGMSFGQARCRTSARALWAAFQAGREEEDARAAALAEAFAEEGLDVGNLHRVPGSEGVYDLTEEWH